MLKHPKEKGRRFELHIAELLRGYGFKESTRQPLSGGIDFMKGDIRSNSFPFFIECKNQETTNFLQWYHKAANEAGAKPPLVVWTKNREEIYAFLLLSDLMMVLTGGLPTVLKKPTRPKPASIEDTKELQFSKAKQLRKEGYEHYPSQ